MTRVSHAVPVEAIRHGVTVDGAVTLTQLAALHAEFAPNAVVELFPGGWVATLVYRRPGHPNRIQHAHVGLGWAPRESRTLEGGAG